MSSHFLSFLLSCFFLQFILFPPSPFLPHLTLPINRPSPPSAWLLFPPSLLRGVIQLATSPCGVFIRSGSVEGWVLSQLPCLGFHLSNSRL